MKVIKNIVMYSKDESEKPKKIFKKNIEKVPEDNSKQMFFNISEEDEIEIFKKLDDFDKLKIEERAIDLCVKRDEVDELFLLNMKSKSESLYFGAIKNYIKIAINEMLNNKEET